MTRILIVHHVSSLGGGTKSLIDIALMLRRNNEVVVCIPHNSTELKEQLDNFDICYHEMSNPIPSFNFYSGHPGFLTRYFLKTALRYVKNKRVVDELMALQPSVIVYNTIVTSLIAKDVPLSVKNICIVRETFVNSFINHIYKKNFEKKFIGVAFIAHHELDYINLHNSKQIVIPDCLEPSNIQQIENSKAKQIEDIEDNKFIILYLGGLIKIKGIDIIFKAVDMLDEEFLLLMGGNFNVKYLSLKFIFKHCLNITNALFLLRTRKYYLRLIRKNKIKVTGYRNDISSMMCASDVVVFPSTKAHQPRPCIEAGEYHKGVILSDFSATKEYFVDGYNALTFRPGNAKKLADKLRYLRENPEITYQLGEKNFLMTKEKHDFLKTEDILNAFFNKLLN